MMTEGEVVLQRVFGIEFLERLRYLHRGFPVLRPTFGQSDASRYSCYMRIERDHELVLWYAFPYPKIDVPVPYHPAEKEGRSFTCAA